MAEDDQERTEEATQTRRDEFRKKGQVANSRELATAVLLLGGAATIVLLSKFFLDNIFFLFKHTMGGDLVLAVRDGDLFTATKMAGTRLLLLLAPVFGITLVVGVGSSVVQTGLLNVEEAITPDIDKINPLNGFKKVFSLKAFAEGIKAFLKLVLIGAVVLMLMKSEMLRLPQVIEFSIEQLISYMGQITVKLLAGVGMAMLVLSAADYFFQRWDLEKKMMMTKQEIKEEHKEREGDPLIKARIRKIQRDAASRRMMEKVPQADVIVTNPTHIAVALKYDANLPAPQVVAKGADLVAEKIKSIAREHNIPIVENKPLARTIYKTLKLGQIIPRELFVAVAEVLSYVYKLRRRKR